MMTIPQNDDNRRHSTRKYWKIKQNHEHFFKNKLSHDSFWRTMDLLPVLKCLYKNSLKGLKYFEGYFIEGIRKYRIMRCIMLL